MMATNRTDMLPAARPIGALRGPTLLASLFVLASCGPSDPVEAADAADVIDSAGDANDAADAADATPTGDTSEATDVEWPGISFVDCPPLSVNLGQTTPSGDCAVVERLAEAGVTRMLVRADCTDGGVTGLLDKRHLVMVPDAPSRDVLWVHIGGTSGQPSNSGNIGAVAASLGYRYVSVAYPNARSVAARCACPDGPRPSDCFERVRQELLYGVESTAMFDMSAAEAIVPRLVALLRTLEAQRPADGWDAFTDGDGDLVWENIALSGFSQGGGMAGMLARDHRVDRVMYLSKPADPIFDVLLDPSAYTPCDRHDACGTHAVCCDIAGDAESCATPPPGSYCLRTVPGPWARTGPDVDGDGLGDGGPDARATPAERQFLLIHRDEGAFGYAPDVMALWGVGDRDDVVDADALAPPYDAGARLFSTARPPRSAGCSEHQSMGADACQPRAADGEPAMSPVWRHAMTTPLGP